MKIAIVLGTRPEIVKMSPVIRVLEKCKSEQKKLDINYFILHTGQHYSYNLDEIFFKQLELPRPDYNIMIGSGSHAEETGKMLIEIEKVLQQEKPDLVLVQGDTNSVLAGALVAAKLNIKVGHVEAGLRSYDRTMPEEINRVLTDHISDFLFAPTKKARDILLGEGIANERIYITGNTIVDAVYQNLEIARTKVDVLGKHDLKPKHYFLLTAHRQENVDDKVRFSEIFEGLRKLAQFSEFPIIYPAHPRSRKKIADFDLNTNRIRLIEPLDFLSFLQLEKNAKLILTDSGGVQEESCILKVPCVTLRDNTERPETLNVGSNILAGASPDNILEYAKIMLDRENNWQNPFGDGEAGKRIIEIIRGN